MEEPQEVLNSNKVAKNNLVGSERGGTGNASRISSCGDKRGGKRVNAQIHEATKCTMGKTFFKKSKPKNSWNQMN